MEGSTGLWPLYLGPEFQLTLRELLWSYAFISSSHAKKFWNICPWLQRVSIVAHSPDNNKGWHEHFFFMSGVGCERFPRETYQTESSLHWNFGFVPKSFKREISRLDHEEQSRVDALNRLITLSWETLLCKENVENFLGYSQLKFYSPVSSPPTTKKGSRGLPSADDSRRHYSRPYSGSGSRRGSPKLSLGGGSSRRKHCRRAKGSSSHSGSKRRRVSPPIASDIEEKKLRTRCLWNANLQSMRPIVENAFCYEIFPLSICGCIIILLLFCCCRI